MKNSFTKTIIFSLVFNSFFAIGQEKFGNEWINYNNKYLKITISQNGVYRINYSDYKTLFDTFQGDPKYFKVICRGKEVPVFINNRNNIFDSNDYIEFYAVANDGENDKEVFRPKIKQNTEISLFSDESAYFLTYDINSLGKRIETLDYVENNQLPIKSSYFRSFKKKYEDDYNLSIQTSSINFLLNSYYETNLSLMSKAYQFKTEPIQFNENISLPNIDVSLKDRINIEYMLCSRNSSKKTVSTKIGNTINKYELQNFDLSKIIVENFSWDKPILPLQFFIEKTNSTSVIFDAQYDSFSISYFKIKYPSVGKYEDNIDYNLDMTAKTDFKLRLSNNTRNILCYDITNPLKQEKLDYLQNDQTNMLDLIIKSSGEKEKILWMTSKPYKPINIIPITYTNSTEKPNFVIITDTRLLESANNYKKYRESVNGGGYIVKLVDINQLYNEFTDGEKNPIAIKRFLANQSQKAKIDYLLLLGKALSHPLQSKKNPEKDFVPSIGYPASDVLHSSGLNGYSENLQSIPTGRISATTNAQIENYLNKLKSFEANKEKSWSKNFLQLSGGRGESQVIEFRNFLDRLGKIASKSKIGANYTSISKSNVLDGTENIDISKQVNQGIGMITFFGHSSPVALDLNIGFVTRENSNFKNDPLYPLMFFNGCAAGNVFGNQDALTNDWLLAPEKGALSILAHSYLSYSFSNNLYMDKFYQTYFGSVENINSTIGRVVQIVNQEILKDFPDDPHIIANVHQMVLQGDPAIRIFYMAKPDFKVDDNQLFLLTDIKNTAIANNDSLKVGVIISNYGIYDAESKLNIKLKSTYTNGTTVDSKYTINAVASQDTLYFKIKKDSNLKYLSAIIDFDLKIDELDETNNTGIITINWEALKNTTYYSTATIEDKVNPILLVTLDGKIPTENLKVFHNAILSLSLTDENSLGVKKDKLEVSFRKICDGCPETLAKFDLGLLSGEPNELKASVNLNSLKPGVYEFFVQGYDNKKNPSGEVYSFKVTIAEQPSELNIMVFPNPMTLYTTFEIAINKTINTTKNNYKISIINQSGIQLMAISGILDFGINTIYWDGKTDSGENADNGIYFYQVEIYREGAAETKLGKIIINN